MTKQAHRMSSRLIKLRINGTLQEENRHKLNRILNQTTDFTKTGNQNLIKTEYRRKNSQV